MPAVTLPDRPFTTAELASLGLTRRRLRDLVEQGHVTRVLRNVYAAAAMPLDIGARARAARLVVAPDQVLVDRSAAWLHGVDTFGYAEHDAVPAIEVCSPRGRRATERHGVDGRSRDLEPGDIEEIDGLRVTTPLRTALDLGCCLRRREALAAMVELAREHALTPETLASSADRFRRRRGVVQLREMISLVDLRMESARECWVWLALHDSGLPMPEPQVWIEVDGVPTYRLDFAYRRARICIEYDGVDAHGRTVEQGANDERRRAWLRARGWTVIVVRLGDFSGEALERWLGEVRSALAAAYTTRRW